MKKTMTVAPKLILAMLLSAGISQTVFAQAQVQKGQVERLCAGQGQRRLGRGRERDLAAEALQAHSKGRADVLLIVGDEHAQAGLRGASVGSGLVLT